MRLRYLAAGCGHATKRLLMIRQIALKYREELTCCRFVCLTVLARLLPPVYDRLAGYLPLHALGVATSSILALREAYGAQVDNLELTGQLVQVGMCF
jgi:hypothetical protein